MSEFKTLDKPVKKEKIHKWGVYRKYSKTMAKAVIETVKTANEFNKTLRKVGKITKKVKKNTIAKRKQPKWEGHFLLTPYFPGIAKIPQELYDKVKARSKGICEICGKEKSEEVHHLAGRRRIACMENLLDTSMKCHKPPSGIHANKEIYEREMKKMQDRYFAMGFTEDEVRWLLGTKSRRLF